MKSHFHPFRIVMTTIVLAGVPLSQALAQTCASGVRASNPASVYVVDNANGTVTDSRTGLMWDRCALGLSGSTCATGAANSVTWPSALDATASSNASLYKGYADWRLPNIKELHSLVELCRVNPGINELVFPGAPQSIFWSSSPASAGGIANVRSVSFSNGSAGDSARSSLNQVRLVRGGQ